MPSSCSMLRLAGSACLCPCVLGATAIIQRLPGKKKPQHFLLRPLLSRKGTGSSRLSSFVTTLFSSSVEQEMPIAHRELTYNDAVPRTSFNPGNVSPSPPRARPRKSPRRGTNAPSLRARGTTIGLPQHLRCTKASTRHRCVRPASGSDTILTIGVKWRFKTSTVIITRRTK